MLDGLNQHELLALIEGELTTDEARDLRSKIAGYPGALETVDLMIQDRDSLLRDPSPQLASDLVAQIEPQMARSMLLEDQPVATAEVHVSPGAYRARHERTQRPFVRFLTAAGLLLGIGAGSWIVAQSLMHTKIDSSNVALNHTNDDSLGGNPSGEHLIASGSTSRNEQPSGPVHHWMPVDLDSNSILTRNENENPLWHPEREVIALRSNDHAISAPFVLAVEGGDIRDSVLARIGELVTDMETASLVRNFTLEEAAAAWEQMVAQSDVRDKDELALVMGDWHGNQRLNPRQRTALHRASRATQVELGEYLAGDPNLAAPAQQQLSFNDRGAEHTVTLPAAYLLPFLEQLAEEFGPAVTLERMPESEQYDLDTHPASLDTWQRWRLWREAIDQFDFVETIDGELMVILPIR